MKKFLLWLIFISISLLTLVSCTLTPDLYVRVQIDNLEKGEVVKVDFTPFLFSPSYLSVSVSSGDIIKFLEEEREAAWYIGGDSHTLDINTNVLSKSVSIDNLIREREEMIVEIVGNIGDGDSIKNWWNSNHSVFSLSSTPVVVLLYDPETTCYVNRLSFYGSSGIFADGISVSDVSEIEDRRDQHTVSYDVDIYWIYYDGNYHWYASITPLSSDKITIEGDKYFYVRFEKIEPGKYKVIDCQELSDSTAYLGVNLVDETYGIAVFVQRNPSKSAEKIETEAPEILGAEVVMPLDTSEYISK